MSDLTKEYLDKQLNSQTKEIKSYVNNKIDGLAQDVEKQIEGLARMTADGLTDIKRELDVKDQVDKLDRRIVRIEEALNVVSK